VNDLTIGPHSIDVTLSSNFMRQNPRGWDVSYSGEIRHLVIDPHLPNAEQLVEYMPFEQDSYVLQPGDFILGCTRERFVSTRRTKASPHDTNECQNPYFTQMYDGRSTMGRLGILSHVTAGYGDYGFEGNFTLEISNVGRAAVKLYAGMRIGQISFHATSCLSEAGPLPYDGAYPLQRGAPVAPVLGRERFINKSEL
jgi:dCTP deaminase